MTSYIHTFKVVCMIDLEECGMQCIVSNGTEPPHELMSFIIRKHPERFTKDSYIAENLGYSYEGYNVMRQEQSQVSTN